MSVDSVAEIIYALLERPDIEDVHAVRNSGPRNAANDDLAKKIVSALRRKYLLKPDTGGEFQKRVSHPKTGR
jgi:hypothetical protein